LAWIQRSFGHEAMPTVEEVGPFADLLPDNLLGGENGQPAFQTVGGRFEQVPHAEIATPTELGAFADLVPADAPSARSMEGGDYLAGNLGPFTDLIPAPKTETEKAVRETPVFNPRNEQIRAAPTFFGELHAGRLGSAFHLAKEMIVNALPEERGLSWGEGPKSLLGTTERLEDAVINPDDPPEIASAKALYNSTPLRAARAFINVANRTMAGLTTPGMIPLAVIGGGGGMAGKLVAGAFAGDIAMHAPETWKAIQEADKTEPMSLERFETGMDTVLQGMMLHGTARHALKKTPTKPASTSEPAPAATSGPATETARYAEPERPMVPIKEIPPETPPAPTVPENVRRNPEVDRLINEEPVGNDWTRATEEIPEARVQPEVAPESPRSPAETSTAPVETIARETPVEVERPPQTEPARVSPEEQAELQRDLAEESALPETVEPPVEPAKPAPEPKVPPVVEPAPEVAPLVVEPVKPAPVAPQKVAPPVTPEVRKAVNAPDTSSQKLRVQKAYLLDALDEAVKKAPREEALTESARESLNDARNTHSSRYLSESGQGERAKDLENKWQAVKSTVPTIEIEVPGDGTFTIVNTTEAIKTFRDLVKKKFPSTSAKPDSLGGNLRATETKIAAPGKPKTESDLVKIAQTAASKDFEGRFVITHVKSDGKTITATDGRRLLIVEGKAGGTEAKPVFYNEGGKAVPLMDKRGEGATKGNYPNTKVVTPDYGPKNVVAEVDTAAMQKLLVQAMEMTSDRSKSVNLWIDKEGKIGVTSQHPDVGEFVGGEANPATAKFAASYDPQFLLDGIRAARSLGHEKVSWQLDKKQPAESPGVFTAKGMKYVLMPMRMEAGGVHPLAKAKMAVESKASKIKLKAEKEGGFVSTDILSEVADFGRSIYKKGVTFAEWSAEMVSRLGSKVKAHLKSVWDGIQKITGDERGAIGGNIGLNIKGKKTHLDAATAKHSAKLQVSVRDAERAGKEIGKIANERRQNAMSVWMEAKGDPALLAQWEQAGKGKMFKRAAKDAQSLKPEEIAMAQKVAQTFDVLEKRGNTYDVLQGHKDNYVPHVWDVSKKFTGIGSGKLQDRFKFNKARTFETFFEGDQAGFKPKTLAIGKLLPSYLHEMNRVIADRQFVQDVTSGTAPDGRPLVIPRGNAKTVDTTDYIVRNADGSPLPKFKKAVYDTAAEAQAALLPGQIVEKRPTSAALVNPKGFASAKDAAGNPIEQGDYQVTNQPALSNWRWVETDPKGNTTVLKSDLAVHPNLAKRLNSMLGQSALRQWYNEPSTGLATIPRAIAKGLDTAQSVMKREMFGSLAPFHQVQEGTHAVGHMVNPFFGIPEMSRPTGAHIDAMQHGLMLMPEKLGSNYSEGLGGRNTFLSQLSKKYGGKAGRAVSNVLDGYQDYLFHQYIPGLKFKTYEHMVQRNAKRYAKELASGEVTMGDVKMLSAEQSNAAYGHLNYKLLDRNPTIQHIMQLTMLAPDFLEARTRFVGQALRPSKAGFEQFRAIALLAAIQAGSAFTLSKLIPEAEYDPKHPFELRVGNRTYFMRSVPEDLFRLFFSGTDKTREFVSARINPMTQKAWQAVSGLNYRGEKVDWTDTIGELVANYIPIMARPLPGINQLTETSRNNPVSPLEQWAGSAGLKISRYSPISKTYQMAKEWKAEKGLPDDAGSYPVSKYQQLRYALEDNDSEKALKEFQKLRASGMERSKITSGFKESLHHSFTGSRKTDAEFRDSLPKHKRALYDLAVERRKNILDRYNKITWPTSSSESTDSTIVVPSE
jgi:hypothetical protein